MFLVSWLLFVQFPFLVVQIVGFQLALLAIPEDSSALFTVWLTQPLSNKAANYTHNNAPNVQVRTKRTLAIWGFGRFLNEGSYSYSSEIKRR